MLSSVIPAQVFFKKTVGVEFMASAVTSPMESQQVEDIPKQSISNIQGYDTKGALTRDYGVQDVTEGNGAIHKEE